ncbi:MFS general substrate transporter [Rhizodiscina lignyota]|uniref:MFS general substrate transporter n=1 Tax=Rhizodiscina lignyota TaxID=1504668 RepID=A0A9P4MAV9_9PEZI|nr:MFS general substrate transporter [Rhizodiscina lignyota]
MYLAYKYAKKKSRERKEAKAAEAAKSPSTDAQPHGQQDAVVSDEIEAAAPSKVHAAGTNDEKTKQPSPGDHEMSEEDRIQKKKRRNYRLKIIFGLAAPFALQALDTTIVASALPFIAKDFGEVKQLNWIISAFNLTSAAFLPFWAQIADIFGRLTTILASIVVVLIGSAICTGAPTSDFGVLLLGRGIQGVGTAGVSICVRIILADKVSLKEYALQWTLFSLVSAVAFTIGPVIGGYLTEATWRWVFAINLPVAAFAIVVVLLVLRKDLLGPQPLPQIEGRDVSTRHGRFLLRIMTIDYGGQLLFLWGLGLLILALTWAGGSFAWDSAHVLSPLVVGAILSVIWLLYEFMMAPPRFMSRVFPIQRAMIPWELLSQRDIGLLFLINFGSGMAMFALLYFMDLYFALVEGKSASQGGIALLYFLPGLGVGSYMAMFFTNVWPRQTQPALLFGSLTSAIGITVLIWAINVGKDSVIYGMMALTGHGIGMRMVPGSLHGLGYFPALTAAISFLSSFALPFGGTVSLTLMSTVFNNESGAQHTDPRRGIRFAFIALTPFMWVCVVLSALLGNVWIQKHGAHEVVNGVYLWSLLTRKKLVRERRMRGEELVSSERTRPATASLLRDTEKQVF